MTHSPRLAVTGSTGHLGGLVARGLADAGTSSVFSPEHPVGLRNCRGRLPCRVLTPTMTPPGARSRTSTCSSWSPPPKAPTASNNTGRSSTPQRGGRRAHRLHLVLWRRPGRDLHPRPRPLGHRAAHHRLRDELHLPARQLLHRLPPGPRRRRRRHPRPRAANGRVAAVTRADVARVAVSVLRDPGSTPAPPTTSPDLTSSPSTTSPTSSPTSQAEP